MKTYDELSLETFIRGLSGRVQDMVRLRNPDSLQFAVSYVLDEENFMLNQRKFRAQGNAPKNHYVIRNSCPNFQQHNYGAQQSLSSFRQNSNVTQVAQNFSSQPINVQPKPNIPNQKCLANKQVFGPQKNVNVFKSTGATPQTEAYVYLD